VGTVPQPVPEGYHTLTPYLAVEDATAAIDFYGRAFGAKERLRMPGPDGKIAHAELEIGDSLIMLSDPFPQSSAKPPKELGGTSAAIFAYVDNVDELVQQAVDAGATLVSAPEDQFWGDRFGSVQDPFGHSWQIATHVEDVSPEDIEKRSQEWAATAAATN
jgi:PhnB protein